MCYDSLNIFWHQTAKWRWRSEVTRGQARTFTVSQGTWSNC